MSKACQRSEWWDEWSDGRDVKKEYFGLSDATLFLGTARDEDPI
jgi:hypothetical protein